MNILTWAPLALFFLVVLTICPILLLNIIASRDAQNLAALPRQVITSSRGKGKLRLAVARTEDELGKGLSGHRQLSGVDGMLFLPQGSSTAVTMLGVKVPLDIVWLDQHNRIVHIKPMVRPSPWLLRLISPTPASRIIEVQAGALQKLDTLNPGDTLHFS